MKILNESYDPMLWEQLRQNRDMRVRLATNSMYWFVHLYFSEYISYPTAEFQKEIYRILEDPSIPHATIIAFRGSGKSTITTLAYPIWSILGKDQRKFAMIFSQTQPLAKLHLQNIKREFEGNELLRADFGPVDEMSDEWGSSSLVLPKYKARISTASTDQSIRGIRHGSHRPDLIITDDVENLDSVQTIEGREHTFSWFTSEVLPAGDKSTKVINIGNLLHEDSLLMRIRGKIERGEIEGVYKEYPIVGKDGKPLWEGKYPTLIDIGRQCRQVLDERAWQREYCLTIIAPEGQIVKDEWIHTYEKLPQETATKAAVGVDVASSQKAGSDYSSIISAFVYSDDKNLRIYILPNPINAKIEFPQLIDTIKTIKTSLFERGLTQVFVETNAFQASVVQQLESEGYRDIIGVRSEANKSVRLQSTTSLLKDGKILFPSAGCEELIRQLVGFGKEKHDDLADAFSLLINQIILQKRPEPKITIIDAFDD